MPWPPRTGSNYPPDPLHPPPHNPLQSPVCKVPATAITIAIAIAIAAAAAQSPDRPSKSNCSTRARSVTVIVSDSTLVGRSGGAPASSASASAAISDSMTLATAGARQAAGRHKTEGSRTGSSPAQTAQQKCAACSLFRLAPYFECRADCCAPPAPPLNNVQLSLLSS